MQKTDRQCKSVEARSTCVILRGLQGFLDLDGTKHELV